MNDVELVLDLSRLLSRVRHATPTGIDRVEMAYAQELPERFGSFAFGGVHPATRRYGRIDRATAERFLAFTRARWTSGEPAGATELARQLLFATSRPRPPAGGTKRVFVQASPNTLNRPDAFARILASEAAAFVPLVHDLIPITHPEFARPGGAEAHGRRMLTLARHAAGVLANSRATLDAVSPYLKRGLPTRVGLLGTEPGGARDHGTDEQPYFVCVATIEPRKNHLLLLNIWRRMAEDGGRVPRLVLVGRRGWENEMVVDMLDRCPAIRAHVREEGRVSDDRLRTLLAGARALLLPSFAEGFGLPVAEALAAGVPVICSDLPALREAGGAVPEYLDPLDGVGWRQAIEDFAMPDSGYAASQRLRLKAWQPVTWRAHFDAVVDLVDQVVAPAG